MFDTVCADRPVSSTSSTRLSPSGTRRMASSTTASLKSPIRGRLVPRLVASRFSTASLPVRLTPKRWPSAQPDNSIELI